MNIAPLWKRLLYLSLPKPDRNQLVDFMTNYSADRKSPDVYLSCDKIISLLETGLCRNTPYEGFLSRAIRHEIHIGTKQLGLCMYLVLIIRGNCDSFLKLYLVDCYLISSCIQDMLIPSFQCQYKSYFCVPYKLT